MWIRIFVVKLGDTGCFGVKSIAIAKDTRSTRIGMYFCASDPFGWLWSPVSGVGGTTTKAEERCGHGYPEGAGQPSVSIHVKLALSSRPLPLSSEGSMGSPTSCVRLFQPPQLSTPLISPPRTSRRRSPCHASPSSPPSRSRTSASGSWPGAAPTMLQSQIRGVVVQHF